MTTTYVWILVSIISNDNGFAGRIPSITYSPPMADLASCKRLQKSILERAKYRYDIQTQCVQVAVVK